MNWAIFPLFATLSAILWITGAILIYLENKNPRFFKYGNLVIVAGSGLMGIFLLTLWITLGRPPFRTLGETRLWYSFFLVVIGFFTFHRWNNKWFLAYCVGLAILFLGINLLHPETYEKELIPALQSPWFVPHVIVYILSYALLAASSLVAVKGLYQVYTDRAKTDNLILADNLVYKGFSLLTLGLIFGALWAKEVWGHYWTWDPKETWALLTWLIYLIYIHLRQNQPQRIKFHLWMLGLAFVILLICWFGINYLPSAQNSVHVYAQ
ncbi:MAG: cytochrome c biogenesis protein CcsA [Bacteroidota bacterium]|nr:cytochrome c biogenesis protein CcsA [Bacteroidota bacterium]